MRNAIQCISSGCGLEADWGGGETASCTQPTGDEQALIALPTGQQCHLRFIKVQTDGLVGSQGADPVTVAVSTSPPRARMTDYHINIFHSEEDGGYPEIYLPRS